MKIAKHTALALVLLGSAALVDPTFAVEPDVDSPAGPENPAPRTDRPDFQQDDGPGQVLDPQAEGAQPRENPPPDVVIVPED
jgi:hypothetical protein